MQLQLKPVEFKLLTATSASSLAESVNEALDEGLMLHGDVVLLAGGVIGQAVVRVEWKPVVPPQESGLLVPQQRSILG
jgi:hypothetical protein